MFRELALMLGGDEAERRRVESGRRGCGRNSLCVSPMRRKADDHGRIYTPYTSGAPGFNFSPNHLFLFSREVCRSCAVLLFDRDTQRVHRLHDFSKASAMLRGCQFARLRDDLVSSAGECPPILAAGVTIAGHNNPSHRQ